MILQVDEQDLGSGIQVEFPSTPKNAYKMKVDGDSQLIEKKSIKI